MQVPSCRQSCLLLAPSCSRILATMDYAVIEFSGSQFLVSEGDKLKVGRLVEEEGKKISLVPLLVSLGGKVQIGQPEVEKAGVVLKVLEHGKDKKISVRRFKSKSRYRKNKGHRQGISIVEVVSIKAGSAKGKTKVVGEELVGLGLSARTVNALESAGIDSVAKLKKLSEKELLALPGIGAKAVEEITNGQD